MGDDVIAALGIVPGAMLLGALSSMVIRLRKIYRDGQRATFMAMGRAVVVPSVVIALAAMMFPVLYLLVV